jgi:hypothetical protein
LFSKIVTEFEMLFIFARVQRKIQNIHLAVPAC